MWNFWNIDRIEVTGGFLLLLAWLNYLDQDFLLPMALAACGAHELGHLAAIRLLGGTVRQIRLTAVGAELVLDHPLGYWQEGTAALAGPGVNLLLALISCDSCRWVTFAGLNLTLALFNLLPVGRLDGGRALYCTLALLTGQDGALLVCGWLDCGCTAVLLGLGVLAAGFGGNITLLLTAFWLAAGFVRKNILLKNINNACQKDGKKVQ